MAKRRFHIRKIKVKLPCLILTLEQLVLLQKVLILFEQKVLTQKNPLPKSHFALATVKQVQAKIQQMIVLNAWYEPVEFNANEITILQSAVWIFAISLEAIEQSS